MSSVGSGQGAFRMWASIAAWTAVPMSALRSRSRYGEPLSQSIAACTAEGSVMIARPVSVLRTRTEASMASSVRWLATAYSATAFMPHAVSAGDGTPLLMSVVTEKYRSGSAPTVDPGERHS